MRSGYHMRSKVISPRRTHLYRIQPQSMHEIHQGRSRVIADLPFCCRAGVPATPEVVIHCSASRSILYASHHTDTHYSFNAIMQAQQIPYSLVQKLNKDATPRVCPTGWTDPHQSLTNCCNNICPRPRNKGNQAQTRATTLRCWAGTPATASMKARSSRAIHHHSTNLHG